SAEIEEPLRVAEQVALELRRRRFARGALRISSTEIAFDFDGEGGIERAWLETEPHAHALVEEMMILANEAVADLAAGRRVGEPRRERRRRRGGSRSAPGRGCATSPACRPRRRRTLSG